MRRVAAFSLGMAILGGPTAAWAAGTHTGGATGSASSSGGGFSRYDRAIVLVGLTFLLGVPLLSDSDVGRVRRPRPGEPARDRDPQPGPDQPTPPARPRITLYDDPALIPPEVIRAQREGQPPPLR